MFLRIVEARKFWAGVCFVLSLNYSCVHCAVAGRGNAAEAKMPLPQDVALAAFQRAVEERGSITVRSIRDPGGKLKSTRETAKLTNEEDRLLFAEDDRRAFLKIIEQTMSDEGTAFQELPVVRQREINDVIRQSILSFPPSVEDTVLTRQERQAKLDNFRLRLESYVEMPVFSVEHEAAIDEQIGRIADTIVETLAANSEEPMSDILQQEVRSALTADLAKFKHISFLAAAKRPLPDDRFQRLLRDVRSQVEEVAIRYPATLNAQADRVRSGQPSEALREKQAEWIRSRLSSIKAFVMSSWARWSRAHPFADVKILSYDNQRVEAVGQAMDQANETAVQRQQEWIKKEQAEYEAKVARMRAKTKSQMDATVDPPSPGPDLQTSRPGETSWMTVIVCLNVGLLGVIGAVAIFRKIA